MEKTEKTMYILLGILMGLILAYGLLYGFFVGFAEAAHGIIQNVNTTIQINESKIIEAINTSQVHP